MRLLPSSKVFGIHSFISHLQQSLNHLKRSFEFPVLVQYELEGKPLRVTAPLHPFSKPGFGGSAKISHPSGTNYNKKSTENHVIGDVIIKSNSGTEPLISLNLPFRGISSPIDI